MEKPTVTRDMFLEAYIKELQASYHWAKNRAELREFMVNVVLILDNRPRRAPWGHSGRLATRAWRTVGGPTLSGRIVPTLSILRSLPK